MKGAIRTAKTQQLYLNKLCKFASFLSFSDILSPLWAKDYEKWLIVRGNNANTIASNFKCLNAIINKAVKMGVVEKNTLKGYEIKTVNSKKEVLSIEDINTLEQYEIAPHFKGMILARDMFLFSSIWQVIEKAPIKGLSLFCNYFEFRFYNRKRLLQKILLYNIKGKRESPCKLILCITKLL